MKIYTKTGDKGETSFLNGKRISKSHFRLEVYGTIDELNSYIGLLRSLEQISNYKTDLLNIQEKLFTIGSHLAIQEDPEKFNLPKLHISDVTFLEVEIDSMEKELSPMQNFILPGGDSSVSHIHVARCICRRAERLAATLNENEPIASTILIYLNRLSDYLFVLGRKISHDIGLDEIPWKPHR
jgi:cob(I)alamin adenosyltransferase